jgi:hypothetical protein
MITRVEYQSADCRRSATVLWLGEKRWHVTRRDERDNPSTTGIRPKVAKSLTSAQSMARQLLCR